MSEGKNDKQNDDEAMDITEYEISETIEVVIEMQSTPVRMDSAEFEAKLTEFFTKHKPSKLKLVSRIAFEFKGQEAFVLEHLNRKYVLGLAPEKVQKKVAHKAAGHNGHDEHPKNIESHTTEKPKSKKKLIMFIIIGVVVAGLGVTGFMMKDKLMAMTGMGGHATEHGAEKAGAEGHAAEPKKEVAPKVDLLDSAKAVAIDSAHTVTADSVATH